MTYLLVCSLCWIFFSQTTLYNVYPPIPIRPVGGGNAQLICLLRVILKKEEDSSTDWPEELEK